LGGIQACPVEAALRVQKGAPPLPLSLRGEKGGRGSRWMKTFGPPIRR
jgi:hypothetical protein